VRPSIGTSTRMRLFRSASYSVPARTRGGRVRRSLAPALVVEYQTRLPAKELLQAKLHEFYALRSTERDRGKLDKKIATA
jgi:hypothetical protein